MRTLLLHQPFLSESEQGVINTGEVVIEFNVSRTLAVVKSLYIEEKPL
jgi:hypothetical protein